MTTEFIKIKDNEIQRVRDLALPIFTQTYTEILTPKQNDYMLDMMYSTERIGQDLQKGDEFHILNYNGKDVGFTHIGLFDAPSKSFKLHKIYLSHDMHGRGLGKLQLREMEKAVQAQGAKRIQLNVNRGNTKAIEFYKSQGWNIIREEDNDIGDGYYMNDYVLEKVFQ